MKINVLDRNGRFVETIGYYKTPFPYLFGNEPIVKFDLDDGTPVTKEMLMEPVKFMGKTYFKYFAAGSDAKQKKTWGMTRDLLEGTAKYVEDVTRFGRWAMAQGYFGQYVGNFTITNMPAGTDIAGSTTEDGFGYIRRSFAEKFVRSKDLIKFARPRVGWMFWQRFTDWDLISGICEPVAEDTAYGASDPEKILYMSPKGFDQKVRLYEANNEMLEHPYIARAITRSTQDRLARVASGINMPGEFKLAVPSNAPITWPGHSGKIIVVRSPIDSNSSIQAIEVSGDPEEEKRIAELKVIQVSISKLGFFSKGCLGIVDDKFLPADVVVCSDDVKMGPMPDGEMEDAVITVLQAWDAGQAVGMGVNWPGGKVSDILGADHDGDGLELHDANDVWEPVWHAVTYLDPAETPKLKKTKHKLVDGDLRADMLEKVMYNLVGFATNLAARTYAVTNREFLANALGFDSVLEMDARFNRAIKLGTDLQKTFLDPEDTIRWLNITQANLNNLGINAPWIHWDEEDWTRSGLPKIITRVEEDWISDTKYFDESGCEVPIKDVQRSILPYQDGTIAQIARITIPILGTVIDNLVPVRPLTDYRKYVPRPTGDLLRTAEDIQEWWNVRVHRINWEDAKEISGFKQILGEFLDSLQIQDRFGLACALWYVAHSAANTDNQAASVFSVFPEECIEILKGGKAKVVHTILTGVDRQVPGGLDGTFDVEIKRVQWAGVQRLVVCGDMPGQREPVSPELPANMIAFIASNADQPEPGMVRMEISKFREKSWLAKIVS